MTAENLFVDAPGIATYSAHAATSAAYLTAAAGHADAASPEPLVAVFGLIGDEFLHAYRGVHAGHVSAIAKLSTTMSSMGDAATATGASFGLHDESHADSFGAAPESA